jgi:hypothetical protein
MKIVLSVVAAVIVAAGFSLMSAPEAEAGCVAAYGCSAQVLVPTPQPIPLRRWRRPRVVAAAPCVSPCVSQATGLCGRLQPWSRQLLLAPELLVRFLRPPVLRLSFFPIFQCVLVDSRT